MSLCSRAFDASDAFAMHVEGVLAGVMDGRGATAQVLTDLREEAARVLAVNACARAVLASATAAFAKDQNDRFQPANDHAAPPEVPGPLIA